LSIHKGVLKRSVALPASMGVRRVLSRGPIVDFSKW